MFGSGDHGGTGLDCEGPAGLITHTLAPHFRVSESHMNRLVSLILGGICLGTFVFALNFTVPTTLHGALATASEPPVSVYRSYYDASFPNAMQGWVVGTYGNILHTDDGGASWVRQASPTTEPLFSVQFVDAQHGWALGKSGVIVATSDGGTTWAVQESGTKNLLSKLYFIDAQRGWAVGEWSTILHTDDAGAHWVRQFEEHDVILNGVWFLDTNRGWVVGEKGTILSTDDGGKTWAARGQDVPLSIEEPTTHTTLGIKDVTLYSVYFADAQRGWITGIDGVMLGSVDSGEHWTPLERPVERSLFAARVSPSGHGWAVGLNGGYAETRDGGQTWKEVSPSPLPTSFWLYSVQFVGEQKGWIVGAHGTVLHSEDAGKTWQAQGLS